jgi:hypothetical protein
MEEGCLVLANQYTEYGTEVSRNIFVGRGLTVGWQPGYIKDIDINHNTFYGAGITYRWVLGEALSVNFITKDNLFANQTSFTYSAEPGAEDKLFSSSSVFDYNLVQSAYEWFFGYDWGQTNLTFADWRTNHSKDAHSFLADPQLTSPNTSDPTLGNWQPQAGSPACGAASDGSDIGAVACGGTQAATTPAAPAGLTLR